MAERRLRANETLFRLGDPGGDVYIVVDGELDVVMPTDQGELVVGTLGYDDLIGEITAVIGGTRTATVRARTPSIVRRYDPAEFELWLAANPDRADEVTTNARARVDRTRVARVVADLVGVDNRALVDALCDAVEWTSIDAGQRLFDQGDPADAAYILVGGQMRILAYDGDGNVVVDTRIGRGDLVGEMGVIEQAPRSAAAIALRDCSLARIPKQAFERLTAQYPALMIPLVRKVIERVGARRQVAPHAGAIAVVVTDPDAPPSLVAEMADEIANHGATLHLDAARVARFLTRRNVADAAAHGLVERRLDDFLHEVDVAYRWIVLESGPTLTAWCQRSLRTADRVVIVSSARPGRDERAHIEALSAHLASLGDHELWLAVMQPPGARRGHDSPRRRIEAGAERVVHLRSGDSASVRRVARLMSGNGLAIAFSGGGARSYGQIGALRALDELGIEVDAFAGTSMGAVIAGFAALVDDIPLALRKADAEFSTLDVFDYTIPFASVLRARNVTNAIAGVFGDADIEDTLIPYVCLSTNLSRAMLIEHRSGPLTRAIRASTSLPGVFPPVTVDGELLVDGGVLENLPTRPLRADPAISRIIAIDVAPPAGDKASGDYGLSLSGIEVLRNRVRRRPSNHPAIAHTVVSSMLVGSTRARLDALAGDDIDLYVPLDLGSVKLLDFDRYHEAVAHGYRDALPALTNWLSQESRSHDAETTPLNGAIG